ARVRPPVPGRALAQRRGRRDAAGDRVAARPGHRLPAAGGTLVLDAAAGGGVLPELRRGRAVACAARGRPAARTLPRAAAGPGARRRRVVGTRLGTAAGAAARARRQPALEPGTAGRRAAGAAARPPPGAGLGGPAAGGLDRHPGPARRRPLARAAA